MFMCIRKNQISTSNLTELMLREGPEEVLRYVNLKKILNLKVARGVNLESFHHTHKNCSCSICCLTLQFHGPKYCLENPRNKRF